MHLCVGSSTEIKGTVFVRSFATREHGYLQCKSSVTVAAMHPLVVSINILSKIFPNRRWAVPIVEEEPVFSSPPSLFPSSDSLGYWDRMKKYWARWVLQPHTSPDDCKVNNKDASILKRSLGKMLSMGVNGKMGIHANQVVWVEDGKAFIIGWDCSCQHVPASGWILGSGFCRPFSFLWKHTQSKICFRFPEDLKIQPKWASSRKFCALITNLQLLFFQW